VKLLDLQGKLDSEFKVAENKEDLTAFALTPDNRPFVCEEFVSHQTGLLTRNAEEVDVVLTTVFITEEIVRQASQYHNALIFTHHHFDYFESERGLQPISREYLEELRAHRISIYVAHAPLDTHRTFGTSQCLATVCGVTIDKYFFDYFGAPTAVIGSIEKTTYVDFVRHVQSRLERPFLTQEKHRDAVCRVAVVAGGGDIPDLLREVYEERCDTLLTGTVEQRWALPAVQEGNRQFRNLNQTLGINLVGGTHYATERPAMRKIVEYFVGLGIESRYLEDQLLLSAP
jgi:putative NIF3 family GTP cyclohydrolase 1 type 2